ncbi:MAG TPA: BatA domain-containing protein [Phycisphaerae bacterium]|nr:BatA domain-containing protein [Phycisphaerae bacterium]
MPLAFLFLSPILFAVGAACVSIPIIIHLLNKRKFRTVVWAAMDFLLAAQRRNARKLKFRRWLLLATRCLALLLLAAGIAQLVLQNSLFAALAPGQKAYVVVWDDSYSMGYQPQGAANTQQSAFERSKKALEDWLPTLDASDKVMIIHAGRGGTTANGAANNRPTLDKQGLRARVAATLLSDASTDLPAALDQAADALKELGAGARVRDLLILTDCSASALHDPQAQSSERLKKSLTAAKAQATDFSLLDFGTPDQANVAVTDLRPVHPLVVAGTEEEFRVTIQNATDKPLLDEPLSILLDGVITHSEKVARIDPAASRTMTVALTIPTAGRHVVEARLPADGLPVDDTRSVLMNVRREIPILMVDGSPGDAHTLGSTTYLQIAFALSASDKPDATPAAVGGGFAPRIITELELPTTALPPYAAVIMSDTTAPRAPAVRDALRKYVENGGLLVIFPGGHTNAQDMNSALGAPGVGPDAANALLPAAIGQVIKTETVGGNGGDAQTATPQGTPFAPEGFTHPVLQKFGEAYKSGLDVGFTSVQTTQYLKLTPPPDGSSEVILRYAKPDGSPGDPAVVSRQVGKGKVVLFASTADTEWNSFGAKPSYVPFMHELMYYAIPGESATLTLHVGDSIRLPQEMASPGAWNGPRNTTVSVTSEIKDGKPELTSGPLVFAGHYAPANATDGRPVVVVNPDAAEEADVRHISTAALASSLGIDPSSIRPGPRTLSPQQNAAGDQPSKGSELARSLLLAALAFFALETLLARLFSVYR